VRRTVDDVLQPVQRSVGPESWGGPGGWTP